MIFLELAKCEVDKVTVAINGGTCWVSVVKGGKEHMFGYSLAIMESDAFDMDRIILEEILSWAKEK